MRELDFTKAKVIDDVNPDDTQQRSTFDEGVNVFNPQNLKQAIVTDGDPLPNYQYEGALNSFEPDQLSGWEKAKLNFDMTKDSIELDMWKGVKQMNTGDQEDSIGKTISKALEDLGGSEFIENRIKTNEIDVLDSMEKLRPYFKEKDAEINFSDMWNDPEHFFQVQLPRVVGGMAGLMVEPMVAGFGITAASLGAGAPMGVATAVGGIGAMLASRPFESMAEAQGQYEEAYQTAKKSGKGEEESKKAGAIAFQHTYNENMKLAYYDVAEVALALTPIRSLISPAALRTAIKTNKAISAGIKAGAALGVVGKESWEEGFQYQVGAESQNLAAGNNDKKTSWADLFYDDGEQGAEFRSSVKGGALGAVFMGGGFGLLQKANSAFDKAGKDISARDGKEFAEQQGKMMHSMIARAVMRDQVPELEGYIQRYANSGALDKVSDQKDLTQKKKSSVANGQAIIQQLRQEAKEFEALKESLPKVRDFNNLRLAFDNVQTAKDLKAELDGIDKEDPSFKQKFAINELKRQTLFAINEKIGKGVNVFKDFTKKKLITKDGILDLMGFVEDSLKTPEQRKEDEKKAKEKASNPETATQKKTETTTPDKPYTFGKKSVQPTKEQVDQQATETVTKEVEKEKEFKPEPIAKGAPVEEVKKTINKNAELRAKSIETLTAIEEEVQKVDTPALENNTTLPDITTVPPSLPNFDKKILASPLERDVNDYNSPTELSQKIGEILIANNVLTDEEVETIKRADSSNETSNAIAKGKARLYALKESNVHAAKAVTNISNLIRAHTSNEEHKRMLAVYPDMEEIDNMTKRELSEAKLKIHKLATELTQKSKDELNVAKKTKYQSQINELLDLENELNTRIENKSKTDLETKTPEPDKDKKPSTEPKPKGTGPEIRSKNKNNKSQKNEQKDDKKRQGRKELLKKTASAKKEKASKKKINSVKKTKEALTAKKAEDKKAEQEAYAQMEKELAEKQSKKQPVASESETTVNTDEKAALKQVELNVRKYFNDLSIYIPRASQLTQTYNYLLTRLQGWMDTPFGPTDVKEDVKLILDGQYSTVEIEGKKSKLFVVTDKLPNVSEIDSNKITFRLILPEDGMPNVTTDINGQYAFKYPHSAKLYGPEIGLFYNGQHLGNLQQFFASAAETDLSKLENATPTAATEETKTNLETGIENLVNKYASKESIQKSKEKYQKAVKEAEKASNVFVFGVAKAGPVVINLIEYVGKSIINKAGMSIVEAIKYFRTELVKLQASNLITKKEHDIIEKNFVSRLNKFADLHAKITNPKIKSTSRDVKLFNDLAQMLFNESGKEIAEGMMHMSTEQDTTIRYSSEGKYESLTSKVKRLLDWTYTDPVTKQVVSNPCQDNNGEEMTYNQVFGTVFKYIQENPADESNLQQYFSHIPVQSIADRLSVYENKTLVSLYATLKSTALLRSDILINRNGKWTLMQENRVRTSKEKVRVFKRKANAIMSTANYNERFNKAFAEMEKKRNEVRELMTSFKTKNPEKAEQYARELINVITNFLGEYSGLSPESWKAWAMYMAKIDNEKEFYTEIVNNHSQTALYKLLLNPVFYNMEPRYEALNPGGKNPAGAFKSYMRQGFTMLGNKENKKGDTFASIATAVETVGTDNIAFRYRNTVGDSTTSAQFISEMLMLAQELNDDTVKEKRKNILLTSINKLGKVVTKKYENNFVKNYTRDKDFIRKFGGVSNTVNKTGLTQNELSSDDLLFGMLHMFLTGKETYHEFLTQQADDGSKYFVKTQLYSIQSAKNIFKDIAKWHDQLPTAKEVDAFALKIQMLLENEKYESYVKQFQKVHGENYTPELIGQKYAWNNVVNRFFISEYFTPKYYIDTKSKEIKTNYKGLVDLVKRKQDGKGIQMSRSIVQQILGTDKIKQIVISDPHFNFTYGEQGLTARPFSAKDNPVSDGTIYISEKMAKAAKESLGDIYDVAGTIKYYYSGHDENNARILDKANFIVLTKAHAEQFGKNGPMMQLYNLMNNPDKPVHVIGFKSGVKMVEESKANKIDWTTNDDGSYNIKQASLENLETIDLDPGKLLMQTDLQRDPTLSERNMTAQIWYHIRQLPNFNKIEALSNDLADILQKQLEMEFFNKTPDQQIEYLVELLPNTQNNQNIIAALNAPGIKALNPKIREVYNTAIRGLITEKMLALKTSGTILIDTPNNTGNIVVGKDGEEKVQPLGNMRIATAEDVANYDKEKNNNAFKLKEGQVVPPDSMVPLLFNKANGVKVGDYIWVTRVPSTGLHSHSLVRIAGFLADESMGNVIITHEGVQKIAGADNDGDVRYIWARFLGNLGKYKKETIENIIKNIDELNTQLINTEEALLAEENKLNKERGDYKNLNPAMRKIFNRLVDDYENATGQNQDNLGAHLTENVLKTYGIDPSILVLANKADVWETVSSEQADDLQMALWVEGAVFDYFKQSKKKSAKHEKILTAIRDKKKEVYRLQLTIKRLEEKVQNAKQQTVNEMFDLLAMDYMDPQNEALITDPIETEEIKRTFLKDLIEFRQSNLKAFNMEHVLKNISDGQDGNEVIGILARSAAAHGFMKQYKMEFNKTIKPIELPKFELKITNGSIEVVAQKKSSEKLSKFYHEPKTQLKINQTSANNTNHAVDNTKYGLLTLLGFTSDTASLKSMLIYLGYDDKDATYMLQHKVMQDMMQTAREKSSPFGDIYKSSAYNLQAKKYGKEVKNETFQKELEKSGLYFLLPPNTNVFQYAQDNPPTADDWNLSNQNTDKLNHIESLKIINARLKVLRYMNFIKNVSGELYAISNLSKLNEKAPSGPAEISAFKSNLNTLGYRQQWVNGKLKFVYDPSKSAIDHKDFFNSPSMHKGRQALILADIASSATITGNKLGSSIMERVSSWINSAYKYDTPFLNDKDFQRLSNSLEQVMLKIAFDVRPQEETEDDINLSDQAVDVYEKYIKDTDLEKYITVYQNEETLAQELQLNVESDAKFTDAVELDRLRDMFDEIPVNARETIVKYHIARFGYNTTTENIGGFANVFGDKTEAMVSIKLERISKFLMHVAENPEIEEYKKYIFAMSTIAKEVLIATNTLIPFGIKLDGQNKFMVNGSVVDPAKTPLVRFVGKDKKLWIAQADETNSEVFSKNIISVEEIDDNKERNPMPSTIIEDMVKAGPLDENLHKKADELSYMLDGGNEELAVNDPVLAKKIADKLSKVFPNIQVFTNPVEFQAFLDKNFPGQVLKATALGAAIAEAIYINPEKAVQSTKAHEYMHPYYDMLPSNHPVKVAFKKEGISDEQAVTMIGKALVELAKKDGEKQPSWLVARIKSIWKWIKLTLGNNKERAMSIAQEVWDMEDSKAIAGKRELQYMTGSHQSARPGDNVKRFLDSWYDAAARITKSGRDGGVYVLRTVSGRTLQLTSPTGELKYNDKYRWTGPENDKTDEHYTNNGSTIHLFAQNIGNGMSFKDAYEQSIFTNNKNEETKLTDIVSEEVAQKLFDQITNFFDRFKDDNVVSLNEFQVASATYNMATTIDRGLFNTKTGDVKLFDFKSSKHSTKENQGRKYYQRSLGNSENPQNKRSLYDKHATQLHMEAELLAYEEQSEVGRPAVSVSEMYIVPLHVQYAADGTINNIVMEDEIRADINTTARNDARVIVNQKTAQAVKESQERMQGLSLESKEAYFKINYPEWDIWLKEYNHVSDIINSEKMDEFTEDGKIILRKRLKAAQIHIDGALADYENYKIDYVRIKQLVDSWEEQNMSMEEVRAALSSLQNYDNVAAESFMKQVFKLYEKLLREGKSNEFGDIDWLAVEMMNPSNVSDQYPSIQKAMQFKMAAEEKIVNDFEYYKKKNTELTKALIKSQGGTSFKDWITGNSGDRYINFKRMIDPDTGEIIRDPLEDKWKLTQIEKEWLQFNWYGQIWDGKQWKDDPKYVGYYKLCQMNGIADEKHIYDPTASMGFKEALKKFGFFKASIMKALETDDSYDVIIKFMDPTTGTSNQGSLREAIKRYEKVYTERSKDAGWVKSAMASKLVAQAVLLVRKANELADKNQNEDKTALVRTHTSTGYIIQNGGMTHHNRSKTRYTLQRNMKITSKRDVPKNQDAIVTGDLFAAFNASVHDRLFTYYMNDVMPEMLATMSVYQQMHSNGEKDYSRMNKWYDLMFRKDILGEDFTALGVNADQYVNVLRGWTYLKVMAFNMPVGAMNLLQGFLQSMINLGFRKWMIGAKRYAQIKKAQSILYNYNVVTIPDHDMIGDSGLLSKFRQASEMFVSGTENAIQGITFLAQFSDKQWENHNDDGLLTPKAQARKDYLKSIPVEDLTPAQEKEIKENFVTSFDTAKMKKIKNSIQGYYDPRDQGNYARNVLLKSMLMFKTWLPALIEQHLGAHKTDIYGTEMKGMLISFYDILKKGMMNHKDWSEIDRDNMKKIAREAFLFGAAITLYAVAHDDDPKKNKAARQVWYAMGQLFTFYNLESWKQIATAGPPPLATLGQFFSAVNSLIWMDEYKNDGDYGDKGELKAVGKFSKLLPYGNLNPTRYLGWKKIDDL